MYISYQDTNKIKLQFVFGDLNKITVPKSWKKSLSLQKQIISFLKLYSGFQYYNYAIKSNDNNLIEYAIFDMKKRISENEQITEQLFYDSYPKMFEFINKISKNN